MWKCPKCSQKNRIDVCSKCGYEKSQDSKSSISSFSFIIMAIISIAIIIGIFFITDVTIDYNKKQQSYNAQQAEKAQKSNVAPIIEQTTK